MEISKEDLLRINKGFGGNLRSSSSIDFAIERANNSKLGFYKKLAYLWRAILVDHHFSDGNKRTAVFLAYAFAEENKKQINMDLLVHQAISVASKNLTNIRQIEQRIKTCIK
jgi:prophage maintenance system killer protein